MLHRNSHATNSSNSCNPFLMPFLHLSNVPSRTLVLLLTRLTQSNLLVDLPVSQPCETVSKHPSQERRFLSPSTRMRLLLEELLSPAPCSRLFSAFVISISRMPTTSRSMFTGFHHHLTLRKIPNCSSSLKAMLFLPARSSLSIVENPSPLTHPMPNRHYSPESSTLGLVDSVLKIFLYLPTAILHA